MQHMKYPTMYHFHTPPYNVIIIFTIPFTNVRDGCAILFLEKGERKEKRNYKLLLLYCILFLIISLQRSL